MPSEHDPHPPRWTSDDVAQAEQLVVRWQAAAERVFAVAVHDPALYESTVSLVGALVRRLRALGPGPAILVAAWTEGRADLDAVMADEARVARTAGVDLEAAVGAAFALRYREVAEEIAAAERVQRLETGEPVDGWLVLEERGASQGDPFVAYRRVEAQPSTGRALLVTTRPDETLTDCLHEVTLGTIDATSGALRWEEVADDASYPDAAAREAAAEALRRRWRA